MENSLAYDMLQELKRAHKRLFVLCVIELVIIIVMSLGFFVYESQFNYMGTTEQTQEVENIISSEVNQTIN